jgi:hypothetical protein
MSSERWSDRDLRAFVVRAPRLSWGDDTLSDVQRAAFRHQVEQIIAAGVQSRVLAEVGALTSAEGIAVLACEVLEDYVEPKKRDWLLVSGEPWKYLEQWLAESITKTYRAAVKRRTQDAKVLEGIAAASSREALGPGGGE